MRPYPFDRLPRVARAEVDALRSHARGPLRAIVSGAAPASEWLGADLAVIAGAPRPPETPAPDLVLDPIAAVLLEAADGARAALVTGVPLASVIIDRVMGGDGEGLEAATGELGEIERGVFAYAVARWIGEIGSRFGVAAVLTSRIALAQALGDAAYVRWPLAITLGGFTSGAALLAPAGERAVEPRWALPRWAGGVPIEVVVRAGRARLAARDLAGLERGDVVVPDELTVRVERGALAGTAVLEPRGARRAWRAAIAGTELRVTELELAPAAVRLLDRSAREINVKDPNDPLFLESLGDTPVTIAVELARLTLPLAELAALAPGEVVRTGVPIGERVTLRAGDRTLAIGELVDVEGELGVRVAALGE